MWLRLRQIALIARQLAPVERELIDVLGLQVCYRDPGVAHFGLENALFPVGNQLLEVVAPIQAQTAGGRYLDRRGGDGGYMVITQCDDHLPRRRRVEALGVRIAHQFETDDFRNMQLHPRDTGATFFEIDEQLGADAHQADGPWHPAGPDWQQARTSLVSAILAAELQCDDPAATASRWAAIAETDLLEDNVLPLENAALRFVPCTDGRGEGLGGIDVACAEANRIVAAAHDWGLPVSDRQVMLCGTRFNLVESN